MKKIVLNLIFCIGMLFSQNSYSQSVDEVTVSATFDIGRNSTGNCSRFGICTVRTKINIKLKVVDISNRVAQSGLIRDGLSDKQFNSFIYNNDDRLSIYFDKENSDAIKKYMKSNVFIIEEDYIFNEEAIGIKEFVVKTGKYSIEYDEKKDLFYINF